MGQEVEQVVLLDDVTQVFGTADAMHLGDIVAGLTELRPSAWGSLDARSPGIQLRKIEVRADKSTCPSGGPGPA
ncbi:MAG: hypothetical protein ACRDTA_07500 [Pseudonocardiaceae bacterium]